MLVRHLSDLGQTYARGSGHHQGGRSGPPALYAGNQEMFGLGQTYARGSGHHQGGRSGPPSLSHGNTDLFGLGRMMVPGAEGASEGGGDLFGLGQEETLLVQTKTAKRVRNLGNFAAAAGGATFAFMAIGKESNQTTKVALGALGGGLALMALLSLGAVFGKVNLD